MRNRFVQHKLFYHSYTFLHSVVWHLSVCHIRGPCLNRSTDLHAIWHVHLWGPMMTKREGEIWGSNPSQSMQLQIAAATWRIHTRSSVDFPQWFCLLPNYFCTCSRLQHTAHETQQRHGRVGAAVASAKFCILRKFSSSWKIFVQNAKYGSENARLGEI